MRGPAGYYFSMISFHQVLKPNLLAKVFPTMFASGVAATTPAEYSLLIPGFLGVLMMFRLSANYGWVSRFTIAFVMGVSTGLSIVYSTQQFLIPQVAKAIRPEVRRTGRVMERTLPHLSLLTESAGSDTDSPYPEF